MKTKSTSTTKPTRAERAARESLRRLLVAYAPVVPIFAAWLAQPEPKVPEPDHLRRAQRGGDPGAEVD